MSSNDDNHQEVRSGDDLLIGDNDDGVQYLDTDIMDSIRKHYAVTGQVPVVQPEAATDASTSTSTPSSALSSQREEDVGAVVIGVKSDQANLKQKSAAASSGKTRYKHDNGEDDDDEVDPVLQKLGNQQADIEKGIAVANDQGGPTSQHNMDSQPGAFAEAPEGEDGGGANSGADDNDDREIGNTGPSADGDGGDVMAVAQAVQEEREANLQHAQSVQESAQESNTATRHRMSDKTFYQSVAGLLAVFVVIVTVIVVLVVALQKKDKDGTTSDAVPTSAPTGSVAPSGAPTSMLVGKVMDLLPSYSLQAIQQEGSPQFQALQWLLSDPNLEAYVDLEWRVQQRFALVTFFYSTMGPGWSYNDDWTSLEVHECSWFSRKYFFPPSVGMKFIEVEYPNPCEQPNVSTDVTVSTDDYGQETRYRHIWLLDNNLVGFLPEEILLLPSLRSISLSKNGLVGTLPRLGKMADDDSNMPILADMEAITVSLNDLTGTLSSEIGNFENLQLLSVAMNNLHGSIPTELGLMKNWHTAMLDRNHFTGTIPSELFAATSLRLLYTYGNNFTAGTLPTEVGQLQAMEDFSLDESNLTGPIPSEIGLMPIVERLGIYLNALTGTLPTEIGRLSSLWTLELQDNQISGPIPSEIALMDNLTDLFLMNNEMTGSIPEILDMLVTDPNSTSSSINVFNVTGNQLDPSFTEDYLCWQNTTYFEVECPDVPRNLKSILCGRCTCTC